VLRVTRGVFSGEKHSQWFLIWDDDIGVLRSMRRGNVYNARLEGIPTQGGETSWAVRDLGESPVDHVKLPKLHPLIEGRVTSVSENTHVALDIGRNDGVKKGNVFIVYRPSNEKLVGEIRIETVSANESTALPVKERLRTSVKRGDVVANGL